MAACDIKKMGVSSSHLGWWFEHMNFEIIDISSLQCIFPTAAAARSSSTIKAPIMFTDHHDQIIYKWKSPKTQN